jgi:hypothetical protein
MMNEVGDSEDWESDRAKLPTVAIALVLIQYINEQLRLIFTPFLRTSTSSSTVPGRSSPRTLLGLATTMAANNHFMRLWCLSPAVGGPAFTFLLDPLAYPLNTAWKCCMLVKGQPGNNAIWP